MERKLESTFLMKNGINNMFDSKHYVPILKWKHAEQSALAVLPDRHKDRISPLVEFVMPKPKSLFKDKKKKIRKTREELFQECLSAFRTKRLPAIPDEIMKFWGTRPVFIDFGLLYTSELKVESVKKILEKTAELGAKLIPILNLSDCFEIKKAIRQVFKKYAHGICIRIISSDLEDIGKLNSELDALLQYFNTSRSNVDLLVDLKEKSTHYHKYLNFSQEIKALPRWRTFIFACGTFPENLLECKVDKPKLIPRIEWTSWLNIKAGIIKRHPAFGDYTIRNPIYNEKLQFYRSTTSTKYTLENNWLILKGKVNEYGIYLANAVLLVKDKRFYGENFSNGDKFIAEKAKHFKTYIRNPEVGGTGNTPMWLTAFINHHLTLTAHQIANLP